MRASQCDCGLQHRIITEFPDARGAGLVGVFFLGVAARSSCAITSANVTLAGLGNIDCVGLRPCCVEHGQCLPEVRLQAGEPMTCPPRTPSEQPGRSPAHLDHASGHSSPPPCSDFCVHLSKLGDLSLTSRPSARMKPMPSTYPLSAEL